MTTEQIQENIDDNLQRLRRVYADCIVGYNRATFKDLAHILRLWMNMRDEISIFFENRKPKPSFKVFSILPPFLRTFRNYGYLFVAIPDGIVFSGLPPAAEGAEGQVKIASVHIESGHKALFALEMVPTPIQDNMLQYDIRIMKSVWNNRDTIDFTKEQSDIFNLRSIEFKKKDFYSWLNHSAIRLNIYDGYNSLNNYDISRYTMVNRVANILGGSHPAGNLEVIHKDDDAIRFAMNSEAVGVPLPYFILIKIAKDILSVFE